MRFKHILIALLISILMTLSVSAAVGEWPTYQFYKDLRGVVTEIDGIWIDTVGAQVSLAAGHNFQPLAKDLDGDGSIDLIGQDGAFVRLYHYDGSAFSLIDEVSVGYTVTSIPTIIDDYDGNGYDEIFLMGNTDVTVLEWNGSILYIKNSQNITIVNSQKTAPVCIKGETNTSCYWGQDHLGTAYVGAYYLNNTNVPNNYTGWATAADSFLTTHGREITPAVIDLDLTDDDEIIFPCDVTAGNEGLCVFDIASKSLDTSFSTDGMYLDNSAAPRIGGFMATNIDGAGRPEILMTYYITGGTMFNQDSLLEVIEYDGSLDWGIKVYDESGSATDTHISAPIVGNFVDDGDDRDICVISTLQGGGNGVTRIRCYEPDSSEIFDYNSNQVIDLQNQLWQNGRPIVGANMDEDNLFEIVVGGGILSLEDDSISENITFQDQLTQGYLYYPMLVDLDSDGNLDVCGQKSGDIFCAFSTETNDPPDIDDELNYAGYGNSNGYEAFICVNKSITLTAGDCAYGSNCNYDNDFLSDSERMVTNCGMDAVGNKYDSPTEYLEYGEFDDTSPEFVCYFNKTGQYKIRVYLQDSVNQGDMTQFNSQYILANVIDGELGVDCSNGIPVLVGQTGSRPAGEGDTLSDVEYFTRTLTGGSTALNFIVGIILIMAITAIVGVKVNGNMFGTGVGAVGATILVTVLGLISLYIMIIMLVAIVALAILGFIFFRGQPSSA